VILVDTSAWVEFLRDTRSSVCEEVDRLLDADIAITDPILMEVLAGARDEPHLHDLRRLLGRARMEHCMPTDYETAALLYRRCRNGGETVRRLVDCLIAAVAIRVRLSILHADSDFDVLGGHTDVAIHRT
jgi:predicted nucleic acid-binding protein